MKITFHNKILFGIGFLFFGLGSIYAQSGCTDVLANNYDSTAIDNDGSCTYDPVTITPSSSFPLDSSLEETSGLIYWDNSIWTHNDNADDNIYEVNPISGSIISNVSLAPQINNDWEEISQDEDYVYIGDFGNNVNGNRTDLKIIRVSKSSILNGNLEMDIINFAYEDQTDFTPKGVNNTDYDCEAFIVSENNIYLFTKEWLSNKSRIYKIPKTPGNYLAELQDSYNIQGLVTGAVYKEENGLVALSGYNSILQPFVFLLYDFTGDDFFGANKRKLNINLPFHQVEGITTDDGLNYFISNEKFTVTGTSQKLHTLNLTPYLDHYLGIHSKQVLSKFSVFPNPANSFIKIKVPNKLANYPYVIFDLSSRILKQGSISAQAPTIDIADLSHGTYILKLGRKTVKSLQIIKK